MAREPPAATSYGTSPLHGKGSILAHVSLSAGPHFQAVAHHKPRGGHGQDKNSKVDRRTAMTESTGGSSQRRGGGLAESAAGAAAPTPSPGCKAHACALPRRPGLPVPPRACAPDLAGRISHQMSPERKHPHRITEANGGVPCWV